MADRAAMDHALRRLVLPSLREVGFRGSLPHLRRSSGSACDLVTFQFLSAGGAFTVEIGRVSNDGLWFHGRQIPAAKLNTSYLQFRHRLGAPLSGGDHWYHFSHAAPDSVAREVLEDFADDAVWRLVDGFELPPSAS